MLKVLFFQLKMWLHKTWLYKMNELKIIREGSFDQLFNIIKHAGYNLTEDEQLAVIQRGDSKAIELWLKLKPKLFVSAQTALLKRGNNAEISKVASYADNLCPEAIQLILLHGREQEIVGVIQHNDIPADLEERIISIDNIKVQKALASKGLKKQESVSQIIDCGHHEAIMALLQTIKYDSPVHLYAENGDKIIFRDNPKEIKAFFDNGFLPSEKAILHLIDLGFYEFVARCLNLDCRGYSPFTEKVIMAVLEKGDEWLVTTLVHNQDKLLLSLKRMQRTQEWLENKILERGYNNAISCLARIYKVSRLTVEEILRRNNKQEIKALIDSKSINAACIYDLIDRQRYDLLENYARCVPDNPTFYLLTKYMKANR